MVSETAAAIMARDTPCRARDRRGLWACVAAVAAVAGFAVLVLGGSDPAIDTSKRQGNQRSLAVKPALTSRGAATDAIAAYRGYLDAFVAAAETANSLDPRLRWVLGDPALVQTQITLDLLSRGGLALRGHFNDDVAVSDVSVGTQTVTLRGCQDISDLQVVKKSSGAPMSAAASQNLRFPFIAKARLFEGRWIIVEMTADRTHRC